jgi:formylglycine-generating enzyme required for sulfatase activity
MGKYFLIFLIFFFSFLNTSNTATYNSITPSENKVHEDMSIRDCRGCHDGIYRERFDPLKNPNCSECHWKGEPINVAMEVKKSEGSGVGGRESGVKRIKEKGKELKGDVEMVYIPAGKFIMGSDERMPDETPSHEVYVKAFYIDKYEVTNGRYEKFVKETGHRKPLHWVTGTYPEGKGNHPVVFVSWFDAFDYCKWTGKRLPAESEWEKAARGADGRKLPWGNYMDSEKANMPISEIGDTTPVGSYEAGKSPYGLYDMAGNVYEWVEEWYYLYPGSLAKGKDYEKYAGKKNKILKGGSWYDCLAYSCGLSAFTFNRAFFDPTIRNNSFGFRCVKSTD